MDFRLDGTSNKDFTTDVKVQVTKEAKISGYLRGITWKNKYLKTQLLQSVSDFYFKIYFQIFQIMYSVYQ
jgi:hypothetical protein